MSKGSKCLLIVSLILPTFSVFSYFHMASTPAETQFWYSFSKGIQFSLPLLGFWFLGLTKPWSFQMIRKDWIWGFLSGLGIFAFLLTLYFAVLKDLAFVETARVEIAKKLAEFSAQTPFRFLLFASFISIIHSFLEEYYWRAFVFVGLKKWISRNAAVAISALGFTGHHIIVIHKYCDPQYWWILIPLFSLFVFVGGALWAFHYDRKQTLWGVWVSHFFADFAIMIIGAHLVFNPRSVG